MKQSHPPEANSCSASHEITRVQKKKILCDPYTQSE